MQRSRRGGTESTVGEHWCNSGSSDSSSDELGRSFVFVVLEGDPLFSSPVPVAKPAHAAALADFREQRDCSSGLYEEIERMDGQSERGSRGSHVLGVLKERRPL